MKMPPAEIQQTRESAEGRWLDQARAGDDDAFRHLVELHEQRVAAVVVPMLGEGQEAEDVGQEVFIRLHRSLAAFRGEAQLSTWLTRIAINLCLDHLRSRQRWHHRFLGLDDTTSQNLEPRLDGEAQLDARERARLVRRAVRRLKPAWRAVVVLRWLQGYSTEEAAHLLGVPYGTVLSRLARGMNALKVELDPLLNAAAMAPRENEA